MSRSVTSGRTKGLYLLQIETKQRDRPPHLQEPPQRCLSFLVGRITHKVSMFLSYFVLTHLSAIGYNSTQPLGILLRQVFYLSLIHI